MRRVIEQAADDAEAGHEAIISWAAHDAMNMASIANTGMIFVPCRAGRSHSPDEYVNPEHIVTGIAVLANAMVALAGA
jgi:N-carbamoyl-L-amino-acid hydrolase